MKKVIKNKVYDTDKATLVAEAHHPNRHYAGGVTVKQWLYRKKTGEYFLHYVGISDALHNLHLDNVWFDGSEKGNIAPLTYAQAQKWAEQELPAEKWIELFGDIEDDESRTTLNIGISAAAAAKIRRAAQEAGMTVGDYIAYKCCGTKD